MYDLGNLLKLELAPYILKATALISVERLVGGNQFRHAFSTLGILLDYKYYDKSVLLKASLVHDLFEDFPDPEGQKREIQEFDRNEGNQVIDLVLEVTKREGESKPDYLQRVLTSGSKNALRLKCADRISNLTDLHLDTHSKGKVEKYLDQTEKFVVPMAEKVDMGMVKELNYLAKF